MSRFLAITLYSLLLAVELTRAASSGTAMVGTAVVRVDDLVILNGTSLQFDPLYGFNETTSSPTWQEDYIDTIDSASLYHIYTHANTDLILRESGDLMIAASGAECLRCMTDKLAAHIADGRWPAFNDCYDHCEGVTYEDLKNNTRQFWLLAGLGVYAAGNFIFDMWTRFNW
ncbi:hypothetical protein QBC47DRAFT_404155 [Echria macrotheca]|uniref:Uncharacterized protein n=1 Tax=Echria macrotheca TaxID=438768 RepID=A0AAJ0B981_9PEZI|nr:hypothetical protein QBC47DRAFT_404155 [Echria macrotheca]